MLIDYTFNGFVECIEFLNDFYYRHLFIIVGVKYVIFRIIKAMAYYKLFPVIKAMMYMQNTFCWYSVDSF